jgi:uncharacterized protein DUF1566
MLFVIFIIVAASLGTTWADPNENLPATGVTSGIIIGEDGDPAFGNPLRYEDNGDGTITDENTGLMWEKKVAFDGVVSSTNLHDADNVYPWNGTCSITGTACGTNPNCVSPNGQTCNAKDGQGTGLTVFGFAAALNAANFAGHNDWRNPKREGAAEYRRLREC